MKSMKRSTDDRSLDTACLADLAGMLDEQWQFRVEQLTQQVLFDVLDARPETPADREVFEAIQRGATVALGEIEAARARMADGSYGRCVDCADQLSLERLEVLPHAARCVSCQRAVGHAW